MASGNRVTLRECRRSEAELFSWYASLITGGMRFLTPLADVIADAKRAFTFAGPAQHNLVISHRKKSHTQRPAEQALQARRRAISACGTK